MSNATVTIFGTCPTHGPQVFRRDSECHWWECPEIGMLEPGSCGAVIPDELVTPDGGEVCHYSRSRWVRDHDGGIEWRVWA